MPQILVQTIIAFLLKKCSFSYKMHCKFRHDVNCLSNLLITYWFTNSSNEISVLQLYNIAGLDPMKAWGRMTNFALILTSLFLPITHSSGIGSIHYCLQSCTHRVTTHTDNSQSACYSTGKHLLVLKDV